MIKLKPLTLLVGCSIAVNAMAAMNIQPDPENPREIVENFAEPDDPPIPKPTNQQMKSADMWVHHSVTLLQ